MKKKQLNVEPLKVLYKTEEILKTASNRYRITLQVANKAKRNRHEDIDVVSTLKIKPVIKAIIEIAEGISFEDHKKPSL